MSKHRPNARRVLSKQQPSATLGGREVSIPHYLRGDRSHLEATHWIKLSEARAKREQGLGEFINRGRAFRSFDKPTIEEGDYGPSRSRATSRKIAEPAPAGPLHGLDADGNLVVPMGVMSRYVADQRAGKRGTAIQRAVEGWKLKPQGQKK